MQDYSNFKMNPVIVELRPTKRKKKLSGIASKSFIDDANIHYSSLYLIEERPIIRVMLPLLNFILPLIENSLISRNFTYEWVVLFIRNPKMASDLL